MTAPIAQLLKEALAFLGAIDRLPAPVKARRASSSTAR